MGEVQHDFWWKSLSERGKQACTEGEARLTNEKFGSHKDLSEEMKQRIATKVNDDKISYGEWKKLTTPTLGETYCSSVLNTIESKLTKPPIDETQGSSFHASPAVESATEQMTNIHVQQSGTAAKQKRSQRKRGKKRAITTPDNGEELGRTTIEPTSPNKLTLPKQTVDDSADKIFDDGGKGKIFMGEQTNEKEEKTEAAVPNGLSQGSHGSSCIGVVDADEGNGKSPILNQVCEETEENPFASLTDVTQTGFESKSTLDNGKGKALRTYSGDLKKSDEMDVSDKIFGHNSQASDVTADEAKGKAPDERLRAEKNVQIVDLISNGAVQGEESLGTTFDDQNGRLKYVIDEKETGHNIALDDAKGKDLSDATSPDAENSDLAEGKETPSNSTLPQNLTLNSSLDAEEKVSSNQVPAQDILSFGIILDEGKEASSSKDIAQNVMSFDGSISEEHDVSSSKATAQNEKASEIIPTNTRERLPSTATAQDSLRLRITLDAGTGKLLLTAQLDKQYGQMVADARNQSIAPLSITIDPGTREILTRALLDGQICQSIEITEEQDTNAMSNGNTQPFETILDTIDEEIPMNAPPDENINEGVDTVVKSQDPIEDASQAQSPNPKGKKSVETIVTVIDTSASFAGKVAIPKKGHLDILHNKAKDNGKEKTPSDRLSDETIVRHIDIKTVRKEMPSDMTVHEESKGMALIQEVSCEEINQELDTAGKHNQTVCPSASLENDVQGKIMTAGLIEKSDANINVAENITTQHGQNSERVVDKGKGTESAKTPANNTPDQHVSGTSAPRAKIVHFDETWSKNQGGEGPIGNLAVQTVTSSNTASEETTHNRLDSAASADQSRGKAEASETAFARNQQNVGSSNLSQDHHRPAPVPARLLSAHNLGATGIKWAYFTHTIVDEALIANGLWLFEKPMTYFEYQPYQYVPRGRGLVQAPIAVAIYEEKDVHEPHEPSIDVDNIGVWINTHRIPWRDVRSKSPHPDAQSDSKLVEYQACESLGIAVWRHDRNLLNCRLPGCKVKIADHNPSTVICLGCGPKTITRYCSVAHQIADLGEHWKQCGQPEFLMKRVIDATTSPARFGRLWPAIRDRSGNSSYERSRQATYAAMQYGQYTLFDPETEAPTTLIWPTEDKRAAVMEDRMERLLNYALFDHKHGRITGLLYRMIRQCLIQKQFWAIGPIHAVKTQFAAEFGCDVTKVPEQPLCECEWVGARLSRDRHVAGCQRLYLAYSAEFQGTGIQGFLEMMEGRYWALRAWRQRHPTVDDWEARVSGRGFTGEVVGTVPFLGPGWSGWGSPADDLVD